MWHVYAFLTLFVASSLAALTIGGAPERLVAVALVAAVATSHISHALPPTFLRMDLALLAIDMLTTVSVGAIALRANRLWPIWVAALMLQMVLGHALRIADPTLFPWLYWLTSTFWAWPIQTILLIGAIRHRQSPPMASWSDFSLPSAVPPQAKAPSGS